jgi:hypothetical protein
MPCEVLYRLSLHFSKYFYMQSNSARRVLTKQDRRPYRPGMVRRYSLRTVDAGSACHTATSARAR